MSQIEPETLLPSERMRRQARDGTTFEVVAVDDRTLGDLTDADARAEGSRDLDHYREVLERAHEGFEWDDDSDVVRHRFERVE
ncbi:MAG: ASCH domain-containing protein [Haloarculaceae archaeon]